MAGYDGEIRIKTKLDNSEVAELEAYLAAVEKKADAAGKELEQVKPDSKTAEPVEQTAAALDHLTQKTHAAAAAGDKMGQAAKRMAERLGQARDAAVDAGRMNDLFRDTKIHMADGTTFDWDGNVMEEAVRDTAQLEQEQSKLSDAADRAAESMRELAEETRQVNREAQGMGEMPAEGVKQSLTPVQNILAFIRQSFQDIPVLFGGIADKITAKTRQMETEWDNLSDKAAHYKGVLQELEGRGLGFGNQEYDDAYVEWQKAEQAVRDYKVQLAGAKKKQVNLLSGLKRIGSSVNGIFRKMAATVKRFFSSTQTGAKKTGGVLGVMATRMRGLALSLLVFNWISKGFNAMVAGMRKGFESLMKYSDSYANSVQTLKNAQATLGNSFAAAFAPIIQTVIPYLVELINWVNRAVNALGQLFAYLSGKSTWTKATQIQGGYTDALNGTADAAKKAAGALAKFDDLDVLRKKEEPSGGGGGGATDGGFEEVPIDSDIKKFGDKLKDIFSKLFNPFKEAWDREGQFVMDSWKYALDEVKKLMKDIGRDFLTMWNQEATISMFADILHIVGDIGLIVGNLARNFREAWNENNAGLRILENIRDIFAIIIYNIRRAADATVEWADTLDFKPILEQFAQYTESLIRVAGTLSGVISDFYTQVLLPLGKWAIEKGLPDLLQIMTDFNNKVNWGKIRQDLSDFWKSLEPFAETVGEGVLIFLRDLSDIVADFMNSEALDNFLDHLAEWMDSVDPEDVAEGIEKLVEAFLMFKIGGAAYKSVKFLTESLKAFEPFVGKTMLIAFTFAVAGAYKEAFELLDKYENGSDDEKREIEINWAGNRNEAAADPWTRYGQQADATQFWETQIGKLKEWQAENRQKRDDEKAEWDTWFDELSESFSSFWSVKKDGFADWQAGNRKKRDEEKLEFDQWYDDMSVAAGDFIARMKVKIMDPSQWDIVLLWDKIKGKLSETWGLIKDTATVIWESVKLFFSDTWTGIYEKAVEVWEGVKEWFSELWAGFTENIDEVWNNIATFLSETWTAIQETAGEIWENIKQFFIDTWNNLKENATTIFTNIKTFLQTTWENVKTTATNIWNAIKLFFTTTWTAIKTKATEIWDAIKKFLTNSWTNVKETAIEIWEKVRKMFEEKFNAVKEKAEELMEKFEDFRGNVKDVFEAVKEKIIETISPVIDKIKDFIGMIRDAIQAVKDFFASGFEKIGGAVSGFFGGGNSSGSGSRSRSAMPAAAGYSLDSLRSIPHLASGSVIRGGNPFLAVLGDQRAGQTNVEAPLSTIRQAVRDELSGLNFGGGQLKVVLEVNGADLAQATLQDFLSEMNRQGLDVEVLGVT